MADQIELRIAETIYQEGTGFTVTADFRTRATAAASTPTSVKYRVDCLTTGKELASLATVAASSSVNISITPAHNAIQNDGNEYEVKQLTVVADEGLTTQQRETVRWRVRNLYGSP
jgi:hypothetical protein